MKHTSPMVRFRYALCVLALLILAGASCLLPARARHRQQQALRAQAVAHLPRKVLWVWERPEDLRVLDPSLAGVAVLEQTLRLGPLAVPLPRRQPLSLPRGISYTAVVRIETAPGFAEHAGDPSYLGAAVADLLVVAGQPGIATLEIDFDARRSERIFYRELLAVLRSKLPPALPLTMTALASWCSSDDWIGDLPVDEAIPMFFRMEPDRRRLLATAPEYRIREPLCMGSVGVSTREPWPSASANKRVYIFADRGWAKDLDLLDLSGAPRHVADLEAPR